MGKFVDLTGQQFGRWTVLHKLPHVKGMGGSFWLCQCSCENKTERTLRSYTLRSGHSKSCGCLTGILVGNSRRKPEGQASRRALFATYKAKSLRRGLEWTITAEQFYELTSRPCHYCGVPPSQVAKGRSHNGHYLYNGIDRVKNNQGYHYENSVPACGICNFAKRNMSQEDFYEWIIRIVQHYFPPPGDDPYNLNAAYAEQWPSLEERTRKELLN